MSRANQAAINRRAGGQQQMAPPQMQQRQTVGISSQQMMQQQRPPQQQQMHPPNPPYNARPAPGQGPMKSFGYQETSYQEPVAQQQMPKKGKISISDAIALTTLRLGRVEQIIDKWQNNGEQPRGDLNQDGNISSMPVVDQTVLLSILSRIENLEKKPSVTTQQQTQNIDTKQFDERFEGLKQEITLLKKSIGNISQEIMQIKENAMKLQMFTMETNQKLVGAIMNQPVLQTTQQYISQPIYEDLGNEIIGGDTIIDNTCINDFDYSHQEEVSMDLKEFVKNELTEETISEGI